jgi:hypothetical protein
MSILKTYSNANNARRAAKAAGLSKFDVFKARDGRYKIRPFTAKGASKSKVKAAKKPETKITQLVDLITRGATITKLTETLGWERHTVRAAISRLGKLGHVVKRTKVSTADGFESHYKIAA